MGEGKLVVEQKEAEQGIQELQEAAVFSSPLRRVVTIIFILTIETKVHLPQDQFFFKSCLCWGVPVTPNLDSCSFESESVVLIAFPLDGVCSFSYILSKYLLSFLNLECLQSRFYTWQALHNKCFLSNTDRPNKGGFFLQSFLRQTNAWHPRWISQAVFPGSGETRAWHFGRQWPWTFVLFPSIGQVALLARKYKQMLRRQEGLLCQCLSSGKGKHFTENRCHL